MPNPTVIASGAQNVTASSGVGGNRALHTRQSSALTKDGPTMEASSRTE